MRISFLLLVTVSALAVGCSTSEQNSEKPVSRDDRLKKIVMSTTAEAECEGWVVQESEELQCRVALPEGEPLTDPILIINEDSPTYSCERSSLPQGSTAEELADQTELFLKGNDKVIFSENLAVEGDYLCRAFAHDGGYLIQLGRIYVGEESVWVITATLDPDNWQDLGLAYFFDHFQPQPVE